MRVWSSPPPFRPMARASSAGPGDNTVRVWDAASGKELLVLRGHEGGVAAAGFSPDGARIVSGSEDKTVRVWDAASGKELLVLRGHETRWSLPSGSRPMARASSAGPRTKRFGSGTRRAARSCWSCAAMSGRSLPPGSRRMARASSAGPWDQTVRVWDAASGKELMVLRGHEGPVNAVVLAGWRAHRQRVPGQDDLGCGTRRAARRSWSCAATRGASMPPGSRRMAHASSAGPMTTRFGCGRPLSKQQLIETAHARLPRQLTEVERRHFHVGQQ